MTDDNPTCSTCPACGSQMTYDPFLNPELFGSGSDNPPANGDVIIPIVMDTVVITVTSGIRLE